MPGISLRPDRARLRRPLVVSAIGWSGSGKTTFLERVAAECARRGIPCAAAKSTHHPGDFEPEGKDTARYRKAGAAPVAFIGTREGGTTVLFKPTPAEPDRGFLAELFPGFPLVLAEGLEVEGALRLLVAGPGFAESEQKRPLSWADLVVTADPGLADLATRSNAAVVAPDAAGIFVDMLEELMERDVIVTCGGKTVPLNPFVKDIVANTVAGLVGTLKKTDTDEEIVVTIRKAGK